MPGPSWRSLYLHGVNLFLKGFSNSEACWKGTSGQSHRFREQTLNQREIGSFKWKVVPILIGAGGKHEELRFPYISLHEQRIMVF